MAGSERRSTRGLSPCLRSALTGFVPLAASLGDSSLGDLPFVCDFDVALNRVDVNLHFLPRRDILVSRVGGVKSGSLSHFSYCSGPDRYQEVR